MTEIEIQGNTYRVNKLSAFAQFHVSRKIAPILPTLVPVFVKLSQSGSLTDDLTGLAEVMQPFAEGIASMSDESSEFVISTCLSVVTRNHSNGYTPIWNRQNNVCLFEDIDLGVMMKLVARVVQESLAPFIAGLLMSQQSDRQLTQAG